MENKRTNEAVSEILGTVLILMMAVSLFSVVYIFVFQIPATASPPTPWVNIIGKLNETNNITLEHHGGEALPLDTIVRLNIGDITRSITIGDEDYLAADFKDDEKWGVGESLVIPPETDITGLQVEAFVVDAESNSVVTICILQEDGSGG